MAARPIHMVLSINIAPRHDDDQVAELYLNVAAIMTDKADAERMAKKERENWWCVTATVYTISKAYVEEAMKDDD